MKWRQHRILTAANRQQSANGVQTRILNEALLAASLVVLGFHLFVSPHQDALPPPQHHQTNLASRVAPRIHVLCSLRWRIKTDGNAFWVGSKEPKPTSDVRSQSAWPTPAWLTPLSMPMALQVSYGSPNADGCHASPSNPTANTKSRHLQTIQFVSFFPQP